MPVNNFAPEMLECFAQAVDGPIRLVFPTRGRAIRFRHRMYSLRKAMHKEEHHLAHVANGVMITLAALDDDTGRWVVTVKPVDDDDASILREAGVKLKEPTSPAASQPEPYSAMSNALDKWQEDL